MKDLFSSSLRETAIRLLTFFIVSFVFLSYGFYLLFDKHFFKEPGEIYFYAILNEYFFTSLIGLVILLLFVITRTAKWFRRIIDITIILLLVFQSASVFYFMITLEPLSADLLNFSAAHMGMVMEDFVVFRFYYLSLLLIPVTYYFLIKIVRKRKVFLYASMLFILPLIIIPFTGIQFYPKNSGISKSQLAENKTYYFLRTLSHYLFEENNVNYSLAKKKYREIERDKLLLQEDFPLLHSTPEGNTLAPFFDLQEEPPNIVFIIVESLSSSYSGPAADELSFTPFLDSLAGESLYFRNTLATGERTFAVLPSVLASLPHGTKGFLNLKGDFPNHHSLPRFLFDNGYTGAFFYGGYARFDHMDVFMDSEGFHPIFDRKEYNYEGTGLKTSVDPVPFGIGDKLLLENVLKYSDSLNRTNPYLDVILTLSMHFPFNIERKEYYMNRASAKLSAAKKSDPSFYRKNKKYIEPFATMLYTDDALKAYFRKRRMRKDHENTIYIILGDHMMTDIPQESPVEKYRVPMIIYSPLLTRTKTVNAVNSHLDITPALVKLIGEQYAFNIPDQVHWLGTLPDTSSSFQNKRNILFMRNNKVCTDFMLGECFISYDRIYTIEDGLRLKRIDDEKRLTELIGNRAYFEKLHAEVIRRNELLPPTDYDVVLHESKSEIIRFSDTLEFVEIYRDSLVNNFEKLELKLRIKLDEGWYSGDREEQAMLICSIQREGKQIYYKNMNLSLEKTDIAEERVINLNIQDNLGFELMKSDEFVLYFWNKEKKGKEYQVVISNFTILGKSEKQ
ncbi:MAG: LTA synthase family protein [Brumimicrobium sp.]|nr:LTA synthase family protein [Brumimicrobium sp.]